jgi:hypothetical protein
MATTRDTYGMGAAVTWIGDIAGSVGSSVEQGAGWLWSQTREVTGRAAGQVQDVTTWTAGELESGASWARTELKAHPYLGGSLAGAAGIAAASAIGVGELAVGIAVGYAAYLVLAEGESPMKALGDAISWEQGKLGRETRTSKKIDVGLSPLTSLSRGKPPRSA